MVDRLVHHAEILSLKGDSYRLKDRGLARVTPVENKATPDKRPRRRHPRGSPLSTGARPQRGCLFERP